MNIVDGECDTSFVLLCIPVTPNTKYWSVFFFAQRIIDKQTQWSEKKLKNKIWNKYDAIYVNINTLHSIVNAMS